MSRIVHPADGPDMIAALEKRIEALEHASSIGNASCQAAITQWNDANGNPQIKIGLQSNGAYQIQIGPVAIDASGISVNGVYIAVP